MKSSLFRVFTVVLLLLLVTQAWSGPVLKHGRKTGGALQTRQLLVVVTDDWSGLQGTLNCFSRRHHQWKLQFHNAVVVGKNGLGIGDGLIKFSIKGAPVKKEGDQRAPAGIFTIGKAFGYADRKDAGWIKNPYIKATDTLICVDDTRSAHYNTLIANNPAKSDYNSFEHMHRKDDLYKWGLFINHNSGKVVSGDGSCIFMHIWENAHEGTVGCTAMQEADLLKVLRWINAKDRPLLVQFPKAEYVRLKAKYRLPKIPLTR